MANIFANGHKLIDDSDWKATTANENLAYGKPYSVAGVNDGTAILKSTKLVSFSSTGVWSYVGFKINTRFKAGDIVTVSAIGNLTTDSHSLKEFQVAFFDTSISKALQNITPTISTGKRNSVTFQIDNPIDTDCVLLVYCGVSGKCDGNSITVSDIKVERGSIATAYAPSPLDLALKSDVDSLQEQINQLKSELGSKA